MPTSRLESWAVGLERRTELDSVARVLEPVAAPLAEGSARRVLSGKWLGHALHPLLTDIPLGCWTSASLLDLVGGRRARSASQRLIGLGILAAVPTAATGASDWAHTDRPAQRVGVAHAATNTAALALYAASYRARRRGRHGRGVALGIAGGSVALVGGFLGGHLTLTAAVTRDNALMPADAATASASDDSARPFGGASETEGEHEQRGDEQRWVGPPGTGERVPVPRG